MRAWKLFTTSRRLLERSTSFTWGTASAQITGMPSSVKARGSSWLTKSSFWYGLLASTTAKEPSRFTWSQMRSPSRASSALNVFCAASAASIAWRTLAVSRENSRVRYSVSWRSRSFCESQWNSGASKGMPKRFSGLSELRMTMG